MATPNDRLPQVMSIPAAAQWLGFGEKRLRKLVRNGEIPIIIAGGSQPRVCIRDLERWLASVAVRQTPHAAAVVARQLSRESTRPPRRR